MEIGQVLSDEQMAQLRELEGYDYIRGNLPYSKDSFEMGYGEGCWFLADPWALKAYDEDAESGTFVAVLDNDSEYWPGLKHGTVLPLEHRGANRPLVLLGWLSEHFKTAM